MDLELRVWKICNVIERTMYICNNNREINLKNRSEISPPFNFILICISPKYNSWTICQISKTYVQFQITTRQITRKCRQYINHYQAQKEGQCHASPCLRLLCRDLKKKSRELHVNIKKLGRLPILIKRPNKMVRWGGVNKT